jgi:CRISPR/Cas system-associated exonuclease Cas4 (RecB family)
MSDIKSRVSKLIQDRKRLDRLLALEKRRRGMFVNDLVFVGFHDVAQHWWCTQQAVLKSRAEEMKFFAACFADRIVYAHRLGLVDKLPRRDEAVLDTGRQITLVDVERLLKREQNGTIRRSARAAPSITWENPLQLGHLFHATRAEKYPRLRWNFAWGEYTVVGVADGLTQEFVYEYKTTQNRRYLLNMKLGALAQADMYGYFFQRPRKRVQIHLVDEGETETHDEPVDLARAEETLAAFARVDRGEPARLPKPWKCRVCEFKASCPISQARE